MAVQPPRVSVREAEMKVLDKWVIDKEIGKCGASRDHSFPTTNVQRGEAGEAEAEELDEGWVRCGVDGGNRNANVGQCFARRVNRDKYVQWGFERA